jgi:glucose-1-phosphate cytidylyltransferase
MKVVILCGGVGSRLAEETKLIPKPMVKIGKIPIVQHIINYYKYCGLEEFILATGYKKEIIERYYKKKKVCKLSLLVKKP